MYTPAPATQRAGGQPAPAAALTAPTAAGTSSGAPRQEQRNRLHPIHAPNPQDGSAAA